MDLKPKIYFRKAECYFEAGQREHFAKCLDEIGQFLMISSVDDRGLLFLDKHLEKLKQFESYKVKCKNLEFSKDVSNDIPIFEEAENEHFAYASAKIRMRYVYYNFTGHVKGAPFVFFLCEVVGS